MADDAGEDGIICRCEEVVLGRIERVIDEGYDTINDVKRITRAGMGLCQGRSCSKVIARIISRKTGRPIEQVLQTTYRYTARPERMATVCNGGEDDEQDC